MRWSFSFPIHCGLISEFGSTCCIEVRVDCGEFNLFRSSGSRRGPPSMGATHTTCLCLYFENSTSVARLMHSHSTYFDTQSDFPLYSSKAHVSECKCAELTRSSVLPGVNSMVRHAMSLEPRGFDCSVMDQFTGFYILHVPRPPHISDTGKAFCGV
jgi:hypothetical protein